MPTNPQHFDNRAPDKEWITGAHRHKNARIWLTFDAREKKYESQLFYNSVCVLVLAIWKRMRGKCPCVNGTNKMCQQHAAEIQEKRLNNLD